MTSTETERKRPKDTLQRPTEVLAGFRVLQSKPSQHPALSPVRNKMEGTPENKGRDLLAIFDRFIHRCVFRVERKT